MIDTPRSPFPPDMMRAAHLDDGAGPLEAAARNLCDSVRSFARESPGAALLCALGVGFVLGWKLRPR